ncbi:unnamed protein product [Cuscuta epithymum]|uniref:SWIM-type domain-containing protein n=1 Tax=Cuscuta epithymum TaxID=186058 RepID=A0AAV0CP23_9ASTE|nr:unnamed protein product [Cuscuta epithymum]
MDEESKEPSSHELANECDNSASLSSTECRDSLSSNEKEDHVECSKEHDTRMEVDEGEFKRISDLSFGEVCALQFVSEEEAYEFYTKYARCHGFVVRKHNVGRNKRKNVIARHFVCNRQGFRNPKHLTRIDRKRGHRPLTRTNCEARFHIRYQASHSCWIVTCFNDNHNHELTPSRYVHLLPAYRGLSDLDKAQVDSLHGAGIRTCHIMGYMVAQKGGYNSVGFTRKDLYNYFGSKAHDEIKDGDAIAALSYLHGKADNDPMLYAKFSTTGDGRLSRLFWADGDSRFAFSCFGDVLAFDTTYKKNKYNYPLVIFSGCNHHLQTTIFGCALVADETIETYKWVLESFLEAMGNKHPKAVVTDSDGAMREAIKQVFPAAFHRLCAWHLHKNACENVKMPSFLKDFKTAMYANFTRERFETFWETMVEKHGLKENKWVLKTYNNRYLWATSYLRDQFFGRLRTTSQCESINAIIKAYIRKKCSFFEFMHNFEKALREYRNNEFVADFKSLYTTPVLTTSLQNIEEDAAKKFTEEIFQEVKDQIILGCALIVKERLVNGDELIFRLTKYCYPDSETVVVYHTRKFEFSCACKRFESRGIPCSHIICAMKEEHVDHIPDHLVLTRWSKNAKTSLLSSSSSSESVDPDVMELARFGAYSGACMTFCKVAATRSELYNEVMDDIFHLTEKYEALEKKQLGDPIGTEGSSVKHIGDPNMVKTKGAPKKNKLSMKRLRHCSNCGSTRHNARTCKNEKGKHDNELSHSDGAEFSIPSGHLVKGVSPSKRSGSHDRKSKIAKEYSQDLDKDGMIKGVSSALGSYPVMSHTQNMSHAMQFPRYECGSSGQTMFNIPSSPGIPFYPHTIQSAIPPQASQFCFGVPDVNNGVTYDFDRSIQSRTDIPNFPIVPGYPNNTTTAMISQTPQSYFAAPPMNNRSSYLGLLQQVMKNSVPKS